MKRVDVRINLSFKNNKHELDLYNFVCEKGQIMGVSAYIKTLIHEAMQKEMKDKNE